MIVDKIKEKKIYELKSLEAKRELLLDSFVAEKFDTYSKSMLDDAIRVTHKQIQELRK